ncbi:DUF1624 domain-containing protein [Rathayibacter sp. VKM Ac-2879]|nr:DUF1624 domain-containing protein [Rathayibacter sp. VKM Ac-2879]
MATEGATHASPRIVGLDVARGLAIVGMLAAHLAPVGREMTWDGRSSVLFAVLAGVSIGLMSGGADRSARPLRDTASILVRGICLLALGLALTELGTPIAVILPHYGVMFVVAAALLFLPRALLAVAVALFAIAGPLVVDALVVSGTAWLARLPPDEAQLAGPPLTWLTQYYPVPSWLAYVLLGLLLARCGVRSPTTQRWLVIGGATAAVLGYGLGRLIGGPDVVEAHASTTAELLGAGGVACVAIGTLTALGRWVSAARSRAVGVQALFARVIAATATPIAVVGAMPLTVYTLQLLALAVYLLPFEPFDVDAWRSWTVVAVFVLGSVAFALAWNRIAGQGPLEWLLARASLRPRARLPRTAALG